MFRVTISGLGESDDALTDEEVAALTAPIEAALEAAGVNVKAGFLRVNQSSTSRSG